MNIIKSTGTFSFYTIISRISGYVRDILIAIFLGSGPIADAFFVAFRIPNTFRRIFGEGSFNAAFVPSYAKELTKSKKNSESFANKVFSLLTFSLFGLVILVELFMPLFVSLIAPGFKSDPEKFILATDLTRITFPFILFISFNTIVSAQLKIGYILSERIRSEYEEFKEAESQLQLEYRKVQFEFDQRVKKLDSLKQDYEVKRLMSLDKGESIKQEIDQTEKQIQTYQAEKVGPQGELMRKQAQMEYDILGKVKKAVDKVAINGGYDYIIDASVGLLYYKPKYDLTDDVLHELRKLDNSK